MRKFFWIVAISALGLSGVAQEARVDTMGVDKYCVEARGAGVYVMHQGKEILTDVHLENGTVIHPDGLVETPDRLITLRPNQCIRADGRLEEEVSEPGVKGTAGK